MLKPSLLFLPIFILVQLFAVSGFAQLSAIDIIKKADDKNRGITNRSEMTMTIVRPTYSRSVSMKAWSKGTDYALIYITAPAKEKGQVFLKQKREMWNWVPSIERTIKIPPSMMMQSWMGSDFTNDDLVQQSSIVKDYDHKLLGKEDVRGISCYKLELMAKPDAPVVWGKIITWITTDGFDIWKSEYFDEDNVLVNAENAYDLKKMNDRTIPTRFEIIPTNKPGNKTVLEIHNSVYNEPVADDFFSQQNMKKIR